MPKIFHDETLRMVWEMVTDQKMRLRDIASELGTEISKVNQMYNAAYRRFGCNQYANRKSLRSKKRSIVSYPIENKIERPKAIYSNTSAMGIAYTSNGFE